jgi:ankyrin repeat protein
VHATTRTGQTALMYAAMNDQLRFIHVLLSAGADVFAKDDDGNTALMLSSGIEMAVLLATAMKERS